MIRQHFNLRCRAGHHHYSPTPKIWVGRECLKPLDVIYRKDGTQAHGGSKCHEPMRAL